MIWGNDTKWIFKLKEKVPGFLEKLKGKEIPGFFHYSLSGDLYDETIRWGLGNTACAVKIYYTLDLLRTLPKKEREDMAKFIKSFQKEDGSISDPLIRKRACLRNILSSIKEVDFSNVFGQRTIIGETRLAIPALMLLGERPKVPYQYFPNTKEEIAKYLKKLDWRKPWGAGSLFSHLIFFIKNSDLEDKEDLIEFAIEWVSRLESPKTGSWYKGNPSLQQKVNGAMKVITGLKVADRMEFKYPEKLIDLCLLAGRGDACDNFNVIYALHYASKVAGDSYRFEDVRRFALERLGIYKDYYFPEIGGFSFLPQKANMYYYGAKITKGLKEPDIHGTAMFLWGISIITQILGVDEALGFNELMP